VTHYEVLGVDPGASPDEVRRAYLDLARRHHPDRRAAGATVSEDRMREVNAAWWVLSDVGRRARYDAELDLDVPAGPVIHRPDSTFTPFDDSEDDDDWRYEPDVGDPRTAPGRVSLVPMGLLAASVAVGLAWMVLDEDRLLAVSVVLGVLSLVGFVLVPVVVMARAARYERR
jgi:hypothetical protein